MTQPAISSLTETEAPAVVSLSFYDHHRQGYGHMPIRHDNAVAEFMIGDYGEPHEGLNNGGEFAIHLYELGQRRFGERIHLLPCIRAFYDSTGSLKAFLESGAWDLIEKAAREKTIETRDDLTALLLGVGLRDRSEHPVGHKPVCHCCGRPTNG